MDIKTLEKISEIILIIKEDMMHAEYCGLVDAPKGEKQDSEIEGFDFEYVEQWCGCCEDDWQGNIYFPIDDKYLQFYFAG